MFVTTAREYGMRVALLEIVTGLLRRYMHARLGQAPRNEPFAYQDGSLLSIKCPHAVRLFDAIQERVYA